MQVRSLLPEGWKKPSGYSNGTLVQGAADFVFVAGQIAWNANQELVGPGDFVAQFEQALANVVAVIHAGGGRTDGLTQVTVYVTDKQAYLANLREIGRVWREQVGKIYPSMALVQVADLLEEGAMVEIQAVAALQHLAHGPD